MANLARLSAGFLDPLAIALLQQSQGLFMKQTVRAQEISGVDGSFTLYICRPAACFFDDDSQRGQIPGLRSPVQCCVDGAFCDQHVLPESADRASIARGVGQASNLFPRFFAFAWPGACREYHGVVEAR